MSQAAPGRRVGKVLMLLAWAAALYLATQFFGDWEQRRENPNAVPVSQHGDGYVEVQLAGNGQGHFVSCGFINGQPVQFMLDTGATDVAMPEAVSRKLDLARGAPVLLTTANGKTQGYRTEIATLQLGDIRLSNVRALVVPGFDGDQVLLGMSALKQLEFTQRGGNLLLRQTTKR
ncbi:hypothetical protein AHFPHNDE_00404 [Pseudomonas sp. MM227]|uniref:retropepsin-like aspartic protease family protein n=1 Tax=Pseudomonas sp. MM227 TaxID=3019968 RepID=UPI00221F1CB0|nr:TIGR02281 family clan AA aspartic protease [Pseudomonas sp. MM227]CAI3786765.1 hypothetical protein AHFPHNDE_00404 [Pseudomonas sp. MM227]